MKQQINEFKRMQLIAGVITESEYRESLDEAEQNIADFLNSNFNEFKKEFGNPKTKFKLTTNTSEDGSKYEVAYAGTDEYNGIDISFDPKFMEISDVYNDVEEVNFLGKTIYVNDYLDKPEIDYNDPKFINAQWLKNDIPISKEQGKNLIMNLKVPGFMSDENMNKVYTDFDETFSNTSEISRNELYDFAIKYLDKISSEKAEKFFKFFWMMIVGLMK
jgi:hypothetical protein